MAVFMDVYNDGEREISLTEHSIHDVKFDSDLDIKLTPKLHGIVRNLIVTGFIKTDRASEPPRPLLDDYGDQAVDENGDPQFDLREIDSVRQLANWAIIPEYYECYRDVTIRLTDSTGEEVKSESFEDMLVMDYKEWFDNDHGNGSFYIHMRERELIEE